MVDSVNPRHARPAAHQTQHPDGARWPAASRDARPPLADPRLTRMTSRDLRQRAQATLAREVGTIVKPHGDRLRVALVFPNTYFVGMSNLGLQTMYRLFNQRDDVVCERAFLPPRQELQAQLASGARLITLESQAPVHEFDVLAFSVSFEWDYTNVLTILRLAGLPLYAAERTARHPLVVVGGAVTFVNPEPLAPFADVIAAGEGEQLVPSLVEAVSAATGRAGLYQGLAGVRGFYVPSLYEPRYDAGGRLVAMVPSGNAQAPVRKAAVKTTEALDPPHTQIFTPDTEFGSRFLVEVVRGCPNLCRFCWAGYNYLPVRSFPADRILELAEAARPHANRAGLVSIALCDHPEIERILHRLLEMGYGISPASLRMDDLTETIVGLLHRSGERSITIAPETGSDRLRRVINKTFTNGDMVKAAGVAFERGWDLIKVYSMIGLPSETTADLDELVTLVSNILAEGRKKGVRATVHVSIGSFVPKSFTPFQWSAFDGVERLTEKLAYLKEKFRPVRGAKLKWHEPKEAEIEAMLSLGDRRMSTALLEVWKRGGRFDGWSEHFSWPRWTEALEAAGIPKERHLREKDLKETLPWDVVDASIRKPFLVVEWKKALQEMATDDCKWGRCTACGVPGNGEDTVLANGMPTSFSFALPALGPAEAASAPAAAASGALLPSAAGIACGVADARDEGRGSAYADKAKGAAYRMKATPDLLPLRERRTKRGGASESAAIAKSWRVSFEKLGDARYLSHRNVMDVLERALRAARVAVRYTEGFNPHIRLSMGPALPLGSESRHELFDLDVVEPLTPEHLAAVNDRLPPGMRLLGWTELPAGAPSLGKAATEGVYRFTLPNGEVIVERLRLSGEGATTPKRHIEKTWGLAAEDQHVIRVVREETVLAPARGAEPARSGTGGPG